MVKLPLWLNTDTGVVIGANSRPNGFVKVVVVNVNGETIHSTLDALYRLITVASSQHKISITDLEIKDTVIKSYGSPNDNKWWEQTLVDFPYINLSMDEHTILTISYTQTQADASGTQATTGSADDEDEESLPGGRGGGGGGGDPKPITPPDTPPDKTPPSPPPITPPEEKDPYEDGKRKGDKLDDDKRSKMQELMDKVKGGEPAEAGEGDGQEPGEGGDGGEGESGEQGDGDTGEQGESQGDANGDGDGQDTDSEEGGADGAGQGKGDGDGQGPDGNCDNCGGDDHDSDDCDLPPQGDSGNIWEQAVALAKEHLEETKKAMYEGKKDDASQSAFSTEMDAKFIKLLAEAIANDNWDLVVEYMKNLALIGDVPSIEDLKKMVEIPDAQPYIDKAQEYAEEARRIADGGEFEYDEGLDPLEQAVQDAEDAKDEAKEAAKRADGDEAQEAADDSQEAADEATEIAEQVGDEDAEEMAEKAQDAADEAQEAADAAKELEEMIKEMFEEEENLDEEDFEEYKEGVLDSLNEDGEDSEETDEDSPTPQDLDKSGREGVYTSNYGSKKRKGRKYVNWETGEIRLFIPEDKIGPNWLEVTKFFSGVYDGGSEIVVDRTIDGAAKLVNLLGGNTKNQTTTSFTIVNGDSQIINLLNKMRMFVINGNEVSY